MLDSSNVSPTDVPGVAQYRTSLDRNDDEEWQELFELAHPIFEVAHGCPRVGLLEDLSPL